MYKTCFGALLVAVSLTGVAKADDQTNATAILDEGIRAQGGEAALSKYTGMHVKTRGVKQEGDDEAPLSYDGFYQDTDKMRTVASDANGKIVEIEVIAGKNVWMKESDEQTEALSGDRLKAHLESIYVNSAISLFPLKAKGFRLSVVDETEVEGRMAVGILVRRDNHDPLRLYFDKETHLLVKLQHKPKREEDGREFDEECILSDYRKVEDTKQPFKAETFWDKKKVSEYLVTEMKLQEKPLDEKLFVKP